MAMYHRIINFSCYLSYYPATCDVNPNVFSLLLYFPDHLILVEQWTSAAKILNSNLLFILAMYLSPEGNCESSAREGPFDSLSILLLCRLRNKNWSFYFELVICLFEILKNLYCDGIALRTALQTALRTALRIALRIALRTA